jgi:RimJ/RimL family protein N-acetyltransferase
VKKETDIPADFGRPVPDWKPVSVPDGATLRGRFAELERLDANAHAAGLFDAFEGHDRVWDYLPYGPFADLQGYMDWVGETTRMQDPLFYAIRNLQTGRLEGVASYLRLDPNNGTIEVGHINYSPALQRTCAATEAMYLMMKWVFEAGYRRYEWKCNALNLPSRRAAERLGFSFEGVFRQAAVVKGRNRDTAWFAAIDSEWPALNSAYERWLSEENFDEMGRQREKLGGLTACARVSSDPAL